MFLLISPLLFLFNFIPTLFPFLVYIPLLQIKVHIRIMFTVSKDASEGYKFEGILDITWAWIRLCSYPFDKCQPLVIARQFL